MRAGLAGGAALRPTPLLPDSVARGLSSPCINPRSFKTADLPLLPFQAFCPCHFDPLTPNKRGVPSKVGHWKSESADAAQKAVWH